MIRFVLRFIGLLLLALAFIFVIYDGMKSIADHAIYATAGSQFWIDVNSNSFQAFQAMVERLDPRIWRFAVGPVLDQPAAAAFAVFGVLLLLLGRKKRPLIGYARD